VECGFIVLMLCGDGMHYLCRWCACNIALSHQRACHHVVHAQVLRLHISRAAAKIFHQAPCQFVAICYVTSLILPPAGVTDEELPCRCAQRDGAYGSWRAFYEGGGLLTAVLTPGRRRCELAYVLRYKAEDVRYQRNGDGLSHL